MTYNVGVNNLLALDMTYSVGVNKLLALGLARY